MAQFEQLEIDQGTDVAVEMHLTDKDGSAKNLTNHTITAKLKKNYSSDSADTTNFNCIVVSPATSGIATISLTNSQTSALRSGKYVYDVEMAFVDSDSNTIIERVLEGQAIVTPSVTR